MHVNVQQTPAAAKSLASVACCISHQQQPMPRSPADSRLERLHPNHRAARARCLQAASSNDMDGGSSKAMGQGDMFSQQAQLAASQCPHLLSVQWARGLGPTSSACGLNGRTGQGRRPRLSCPLIKPPCLPSASSWHCRRHSHSMQMQPTCRCCASLEQQPRQPMYAAERLHVWLWQRHLQGCARGQLPQVTR